MSLEIKGILSHIGTEEVVSDKFKKREFVIDVTNGTYTDRIAMQFSNDKCSKLDGMVIGSEVSVAFNLRSREYNGKWYTNCDAWKITSTVVANQPPASGGLTVEGKSPF